MSRLTSTLATVRERTRARVDQELALALPTTAMPGFPDAVPQLLREALDQASRGGRAMRPALLAVSAAAVGTASHEAPATEQGEPWPDSLWSWAAALELFQAAALIHDDIIDQAELRRGRPATHTQLRTAHAEAQWQGDPAHFGQAAAILAGDLALMLADNAAHAGAAALPAAIAAAAWDQYAAMCRQVAFGQYLDLALEVRPAAVTDADSLAAAWSVIDTKTAGYSARTPLVLGAIVVGGDAQSVAAMGRVGSALGRAFQLRDDVAGVFADPLVTGKPVGGDLREAKRTVLLATAMERADAPTREWIQMVLADPPLDATAVARLASLIASSGARDEIERQIADLRSAALSELDGLDLPGGSEQLVELIDLVLS